MPTVKITKLEVDKAIATGTDYLLWDAAIKGFGLKISKNGVKTYVVQYRTAGGRSGTTKRITIGKHGSPWTAETAREEARKILGQIVNGLPPTSAQSTSGRIRTVSELCEAYLIGGTGLKKQSTLDTDKGRIERHIKPLIGKRLVADFKSADVENFMRSVASGATASVIKTGKHGKAVVKGGSGTASRTVGLLGGVFAYAKRLGLISSNPVHGVKRFPDRKNERFLSLAEIEKLGFALRKARSAGKNTMALDVIELLLLTGARRGEIEKLKWNEFDPAGRRLKLANSKTGQKSIPLNDPALAILLERQNLAQERMEYVFPATIGDKYYVGTSRVWAALRNDAGLSNVRIHDLRHSFASVGASSGTPLLVIGAILGHADYTTTQRYAHLSANPLVEATNSIGNVISAALYGAESKKIG